MVAATPRSVYPLIRGGARCSGPGGKTAFDRSAGLADGRVTCSTSCSPRLGYRSRACSRACVGSLRAATEFSARRRERSARSGTAVAGRTSARRGGARRSVEPSLVGARQRRASRAWMVARLTPGAVQGSAGGIAPSLRARWKGRGDVFPGCPRAPFVRGARKLRTDRSWRGARRKAPPARRGLHAGIRQLRRERCPGTAAGRPRP
ncbi:MAG: hypothetical protein JWN81_2692 [Solirubrobacterales bacterium]|nr:hypothetical protein [Solirubrobacterales bacterium]